MPRPVEVIVKLYDFRPGESEVEISIPETSELGRLLAGASPAEETLLFARLRCRLVAELTDAFSGLERPWEPAGLSSGRARIQRSRGAQ